MAKFRSLIRNYFNSDQVVPTQISLKKNKRKARRKDCMAKPNKSEFHPAWRRVCDRWVDTRLEVRPGVTTPVHELYNTYLLENPKHYMDIAQFGKVMKSRFKNQKCRRGGQGAQIYVYKDVAIKALGGEYDAQATGYATCSPPPSHEWDVAVPHRHAALHHGTTPPPTHSAYSSPVQDHQQSSSPWDCHINASATSEACSSPFGSVVSQAICTMGWDASVAASTQEHMPLPIDMSMAAARDSSPSPQDKRKSPETMCIPKKRKIIRENFSNGQNTTEKSNEFENAANWKPSMSHYTLQEYGRTVNSNPVIDAATPERLSDRCTNDLIAYSNYMSDARASSAVRSYGDNMYELQHPYDLPENLPAHKSFPSPQPSQALRQSGEADESEVARCRMAIGRRWVDNNIMDTQGTTTFMWEVMAAYSRDHPDQPLSDTSMAMLIRNKFPSRRKAMQSGMATIYYFQNLDLVDRTGLPTKLQLPEPRTLQPEEATPIRSAASDVTAPVTLVTTEHDGKPLAVYNPPSERIFMFGDVPCVALRMTASEGQPAGHQVPSQASGVNVSYEVLPLSGMPALVTDEQTSLAPVKREHLASHTDSTPSPPAMEVSTHIKVEPDTTEGHSLQITPPPCETRFQPETKLVQSVEMECQTSKKPSRTWDGDMRKYACASNTLLYRSKKQRLKRRYSIDQQERHHLKENNHKPVSKSDSEIEKYGSESNKVYRPFTKTTVSDAPTVPCLNEDNTESIKKAMIETVFKLLSRDGAALPLEERARMLELALYKVNPAVSYDNHDEPSKCVASRNLTEAAARLSRGDVSQLLYHHQRCSGQGCAFNNGLCRVMRAAYTHISIFRHRCEVWKIFTKIISRHSKYCRVAQCPIQFCHFMKHEQHQKGKFSLNDLEKDQSDLLLAEFSKCEQRGRHGGDLQCQHKSRVQLPLPSPGVATTSSPAVEERGLALAQQMFLGETCSDNKSVLIAMQIAAAMPNNL